MERPGSVELGVMRLPPGFRFHPTDEELVVHYLRRKVFSRPLPASVIPEVDLDKFDPWDLPGVLDGERYFFNLKKAKYWSRASLSGYWKATGNEKQIRASGCDQLVGMKRVLVFHSGKLEHVSRTDWVMHEYRLADTFHQRRKSNHDSMVETENWVACRIFKKKKKREIPKRYKRRARNIITMGTTNLTVQRSESDFGPPSPASCASSCVTDLSGESSDGEDGGTAAIATSPNRREA